MEPWQVWLQHQDLDTKLRTEIQGLMDRGEISELKERFSQELHFGTGGLRAKMGAGTNRMNLYTLRKATAGVVSWMKEILPPENLRLVIGYDGRTDSDVFAREAASVANALGVVAYVFAAARPTPLLSFAVRHLGCGAGIMITASHNPAEYNGYKAYGQDGGQLLPDDAGIVTRYMSEISDAFTIPVMAAPDARRQGLLFTVEDEVESAYFAAVAPLYRTVDSAGKHNTVIVYTPLHGTGGSMVPHALHEAGFTQVHPVAVQSVLDGQFTYVKNPNPEEFAAYDLALEEAKALQADVILATDPDADRVGVMARTEQGEYVLLPGNEVGALILDDYLRWRRETKQWPEHGVLVTTNVTSDFGEKVAQKRGLATERVLTGFKYIGAKIAEFEKTNDRTFVFGYEESVGYLALPFVRDKDSVQGVLLIANMVAHLKGQGISLVQRLSELRQEFGYFADRLISYTFPGVSGSDKMQALMEQLRAQPLQVPELQLEAIEDCLLGTRVDVDHGSQQALGLPTADVVKYWFAGNAWTAVRPSGTEPKLKVYLGVCGRDEIDANQQLDALFRAIDARVHLYMNS